MSGFIDRGVGGSPPDSPGGPSVQKAKGMASRPGPKFGHCFVTLAFLALMGCAHATRPPARAPIDTSRLDVLAAQAMTATGARGLAIAVIEAGRMVSARSYGVRNEAGEPLTTDTIMYGASLTKAAFGYFALQLVDEGKLALDQPIAALLPRPLPEYSTQADHDAYGNWGDLADDRRWRDVTPRHVLTHSTGFANFSFLEPDGKLRFHFDPGAYYSYSGEGIMLLQFGLERGSGLRVGAEMKQRFFDPLGMTRTSLIWRPDFVTNLADGFRADGSVEPHDERSRVRAAGSMDTTISDMGRLAAAMARGFGLSKAARRAFVSPQLAILSPGQFPGLQPPPAQAAFPGLAAGVGIITFEGPMGRGFFKGGHNDSTANMMVCLETGQRCVVVLANDVRAEPAFPALFGAILGETGMPWGWEYGGMKFWTP